MHSFVLWVIAPQLAHAPFRYVLDLAADCTIDRVCVCSGDVRVSDEWSNTRNEDTKASVVWRWRGGSIRVKAAGGEIGH